MSIPDLLLAPGGIFPVTREANGHPLPSPPASGFPFPGTIQGEGKLCGTPALFVRLAGCNLQCAWKGSACDTPRAASRATGAYSLPAWEIASILEQNRENIHHVVITGGEPLLQADGVEALCRMLKQREMFHVTIESNATIYDERVAAIADLMSLSPKLSTSAPARCREHHQARLRPTVIQRFISRALLQQNDFQLKFVYSAEEDVREIRQLLSSLHGWRNDDVLLMPLGTTPAMLQRNARAAAGHAIRNGWRYCHRVHLSLFGDRQGV